MGAYRNSRCGLDYLFLLILSLAAFSAVADDEPAQRVYKSSTGVTGGSCADVIGKMAVAGEWNKSFDGGGKTGCNVQTYSVTSCADTTPPTPPTSATGVVEFKTVNSCYNSSNPSTQKTTYSYAMSIAYKCPDSTETPRLVGGVYVCKGSCNPPQVKNPYNQQCQNPCDNGPTSAAGSSVMVAYSSGPSPGTIDVGGCTYKTGDSVCLTEKGVCSVSLGSQTGGYSSAASGNSAEVGGGGAAGTGTSFSDKNANDCIKSGGYYGTVNGVSGCAKGAGGSTATSTASATKSETKSDGSKAETTTKVETSCQNGVCTDKTTTSVQQYDATGTAVGAPVVTVNVTTGSGAGAGTANPLAPTKTTGSGSGDEASSICKTNPELTMCKNSTWTAGDCAAQPACSGDAVECATAKAVWQTNCQFQAGNGSSVAEKIVAGNDPLKGSLPTDSANVGSVDVSSGIRSDAFLSASCPPDRTFTVAGATFVFSLGPVCKGLTLAGQAAVAVCLLLAAIIVFKG